MDLNIHIVDLPVNELLHNVEEFCPLRRHYRSVIGGYYSESRQRQVYVLQSEENLPHHSPVQSVSLL